MTGIAHNDTNMKIRHQHTTKYVHCYIFMNNTSELTMSWILGNITQLCIHVSVYTCCDFLSYLHTVHESRCIHIVTFCPIYLRYMNQGIYIYILWLFILPTYMLSKNISCDVLSCDFLSTRVKNIDCDYLSCDLLS